MKKTNKQRVLSAVGIVAAAVVITSPALVSAAVDTKSTTINASIGAAISMTTSSTVNVSLTPTSGGVVSSASDTVTVNTNNGTGYVLGFSNGDTTTSLVSGGNNITAHAGTFAAPTTLANNTWGYRVVNAGGFGASAYSAESNNVSSTSTWAGVPSSSSVQTLKTTASAATNDVTTVWYGVKATSSQPNGTYTDTVTYTATTNV